VNEKLRQGLFFPSLLERRRPVDQALFAVVMEAYLQGIARSSCGNGLATNGGSVGSHVPLRALSLPS
jgi:putative transposase